MALGVGASPVAANEHALSESLALSAVEWVERAVPAAPKSMKAGRGVVPVRSKTRLATASLSVGKRGELGLVAAVYLSRRSREGG